MSIGISFWSGLSDKELREMANSEIKGRQNLSPEEIADIIVKLIQKNNEQASVSIANLFNRLSAVDGSLQKQMTQVEQELHKMDQGNQRSDD